MEASARERPASTPTPPPRESFDFSMSDALLVFVPRASRAAVRFASPADSGASWRAPAGIETAIRAMGSCLFCLTSNTPPPGNSARS